MVEGGSEVGGHGGVGRGKHSNLSVLVVAVERGFGAKFTSSEVSKRFNVGEFMARVACKLCRMCEHS